MHLNPARQTVPDSVEPRAGDRRARPDTVAGRTHCRHHRRLRRRSRRSPGCHRAGAHDCVQTAARSVVLTLTATRRWSFGPNRHPSCSLIRSSASSCWPRRASMPPSCCRSTRSSRTNRRSRSSIASSSAGCTFSRLSSARLPLGAHRRGRVDLLEKLGRTNDFTARPIELVERLDGVSEPLSSTAIRRALAGGDVTRAASMLWQLRRSPRRGDDG